MLPLLSLHAIAAQRGDGLHPELLAGLKRLASERREPFAMERDEGLIAGPAGDRPMRDRIANPQRECE